MRHLLTLLACCTLFSACTMGNYHTARVHEKSVSHFGLNFGWNTYSAIDSSSQQVIEDSAITLPIILPELAFSTSLNDKWEIGGRASPQALGIEGFVKWGFLQKHPFYLALAPTIGAQALPSLGWSKLPLLATYEVNETFGLHTSFHVGGAAVNKDDDKDSDNWLDAIGDSNWWGFSLGGEFRGNTFVIRPIVDFSMISPVDATAVDWDPFARTSFAIHLGWILGQEKKQLDRIERKLFEDEDKEK